MNPFDDDTPPRRPPSHGFIGGASTNPFGDDDYDAPSASNTNATSGVNNSSGAIVCSTFLDSNNEEFYDGDDGTAAESAWQDLGDLPYRRVRLYSNVAWGRMKNTQNMMSTNNTNNPDDGGIESTMQQHEQQTNEERFGLSWYPKTYVETVRAHQSAVLVTSGDKGEIARLLSTTTTTFVAGCPNGGPIASVTIPLTGGGGGFGSTSGGGTTSGFGPRTTIRIMNNAGVVLSTILFPPRDLAVTVQSKRVQMHRGPSDILSIGFTSRCVLVVVLRDSLTLCYDLSGKNVLPPFFALPEKSHMTGNDLLEASVFEGGVAVLGSDMNSAVVELLDEHDDPSYADGADVASRRIVPLVAPSLVNTASQDGTTQSAATTASPFFLSPPPHYAIVTPLPTAMFARAKHLSFGCIAVLPRQYSPSRRPELFLSTSDGSVVVSELQPSLSPNNGLTDVDCRSKIGSSGSIGIAPIVSMSFAPNGRFLACFTSNSVLTVVSTTFESIVLEFDTSSGSSSPPRSMGWCGEDSVVMHLKNIGVLMVGPYGDWLRFPYGQDGNGEAKGSDSVYLVPEIDCCRVVTSSSVEILQRVPPGTSDLLRIGSIEPGALLLDASDAFDSGSSNADEAARSITQQEGLLEEAIRGCITAAVGEFDIKIQKRMLRAASYGLHFACKDENSPSRTTGRPSPEAVIFVKAARKLRVLNAVRRPATGFAMTSAQYDSVMPRGVVARLMAAGRPAQASSISEYLKLGRQVRDYARAMKAAAFVTSCSTLSSSNQIFSTLTDSQIAEKAIRIIRGEDKKHDDLVEKDTSTATPSPGMYASVALAAHRVGRRGVADLLIMLEQSPSDKVHALVSISSFADAAAVAARARDPDLIYTAMSAYEQGLSDKEDGKSSYITGIVNKFPMEAVNMFTSYHSRIGLLGGDGKPMINILLRRQKDAEAGSKMAKRALILGQSFSAVADNEKEAQKVEILKEASRIFGLGGKDCAFQKSCTDEYLDLISDQENLRRTYGSMEVAPPSSSVTGTIASILKYGAVDPRSVHRLFADADKLAKKYKISDKRLWYVKLQAFSESGQWAVLRNFADSRAKPPIGIKPFALAVIKGGQGEAELMHYISRMQGQSEGDDRYDLFCEARLWKKALEEAVKLGDGSKIANVRDSCNSPDVHRIADKYL